MEETMALWRQGETAPTILQMEKSRKEEKS